jgi:endonuclease/exonuclease/phosphatase family metal-dependent hydrolase
MARHRRIVVRVLSWNLYHGRDRPPDRALFTTRSRLLRVTEANATHVQVNRTLLNEFADRLASEDWAFALLQEAPPRWLRPLARRCRASGVSALTSRNLGAALRSFIADLSPDLIGANEGGSNQLLVRPPWRIAEVRRFTIARRPERRRMLWTRVERAGGGGAIAVANLHATTGNPAVAGPEVERAAQLAVELSGSLPLVFGGDLNLRPRRSPDVFERLRDRFGLAPPTAPDAIDHLLARGLQVAEAPRALPPEWRELPCEHRGRRLALRLSDHAPVVATFEGPATRAGMR